MILCDIESLIEESKAAKSGFLHSFIPGKSSKNIKAIQASISKYGGNVVDGSSGLTLNDTLTRYTRGKRIGHGVQIMGGLLGIKHLANKHQEKQDKLKALRQKEFDNKIKNIKNTISDKIDTTKDSISKGIDTTKDSISKGIDTTEDFAVKTTKDTVQYSKNKSKDIEDSSVGLINKLKSSRKSIEDRLDKGESPWKILRGD